MDEVRRTYNGRGNRKQKMYRDSTKRRCIRCVHNYSRVHDFQSQVKRSWTTPSLAPYFLSFIWNSYNLTFELKRWSSCPYHCCTNKRRHFCCFDLKISCAIIKSSLIFTFFVFYSIHWPVTVARCWRLDSWATRRWSSRGVTIALWRFGTCGHEPVSWSSFSSFIERAFDRTTFNQSTESKVSFYFSLFGVFVFYLLRVELFSKQTKEGRISCGWWLNGLFFFIDETCVCDTVFHRRKQHRQR